MKPDGSACPSNGHVVLVYDERTPAFKACGRAQVAFEVAKEALRMPGTLRKCSWQRIVAHLRTERILPWLTDGLGDKYGL